MTANSEQIDVPRSELVPAAAARAFIDGSTGWEGVAGYSYLAGLRDAAPIILAAGLVKIADELQDTADAEYGSTDARFAYEESADRIRRWAAGLCPPEMLAVIRDEAS